MKTPEQIQEYLTYIRKQKEVWKPESVKSNASTDALIAAKVAEELETALVWVLDQEKPEQVSVEPPVGFWGIGR
jgi:hypothetical protein